MRSGGNALVLLRQKERCGRKSVAADFGGLHAQHLGFRKCVSVSHDEADLAVSRHLGHAYAIGVVGEVKQQALQTEQNAPSLGPRP